MLLASCEKRCYGSVAITEYWSRQMKCMFGGTLLTMTRSNAIRQDHPEPLPTPAVLGRFAAGKHLRDARVLELAVAEWLEALSENWYETLPAEYIEAFLPEFVGSVAEDKIRLEEEIPYA